MRVMLKSSTAPPSRRIFPLITAILRCGSSDHEIAWSVSPILSSGRSARGLAFGLIAGCLTAGFVEAWRSGFFLVDGRATDSEDGPAGVLDAVEGRVFFCGGCLRTGLLTLADGFDRTGFLAVDCNDLSGAGVDTVSVSFGCIT